MPSSHYRLCHSNWKFIKNRSRRLYSCKSHWILSIQLAWETPASLQSILEGSWFHHSLLLCIIAPIPWKQPSSRSTLGSRLIWAEGRPVLISDTQSSSVIRALKMILSCFGIPQVLCMRSDNGPHKFVNSYRFRQQSAPPPEQWTDRQCCCQVLA